MRPVAPVPPRATFVMRRSVSSVNIVELPGFTVTALDILSKVHQNQVRPTRTIVYQNSAFLTRSTDQEDVRKGGRKFSSDGEDENKKTTGTSSVAAI